VINHAEEAAVARLRREHLEAGLQELFVVRADVAKTNRGAVVECAEDLTRSRHL